MRWVVWIGLVLLADVCSSLSANVDCTEHKECFFGALYPTIIDIAQSHSARRHQNQHLVNSTLDAPEVNPSVLASLARFSLPWHCADYFADVLVLKTQLGIPPIAVAPNRIWCDSRRVYSSDDVGFAYFVLITSLFLHTVNVIYYGNNK